MALNCILTTPESGRSHSVRSRQSAVQFHSDEACCLLCGAGLNEYLYGIAEDLEQLNALDVGQSALCTP